MGGSLWRADPVPGRANRPTFVYALVDPRDDVVRYVGRTVHPDMRLAQHTSPHARPSVRAWVLDLRRHDREPRMDVLCIVAAYDDPGAIEQAFIRMHAATILNVHLDGTRCPPARPRTAPFVSIGAARLRERIASPGRSNALSRRIGAPFGLVSRWSRGLVRPNAKWCAALEAECGIPVRDWIVPTTSEGGA